MKNTHADINNNNVILFSSWKCSTLFRLFSNTLFKHMKIKVSPEASRLSCCHTVGHRLHAPGSGGQTEAVLGEDERPDPSALWVGEESTQREKRKVGVMFEGHWGRKLTEGQQKVAKRILGRWRIWGSEPCRVCEKDGEWMDSRNLLERKRKKNKKRGFIFPAEPCLNWFFPETMTHSLAGNVPGHKQSETPDSTALTPVLDVEDAAWTAHV